MRAVTVVRGGGIGHDQEASIRAILSAASVPIELHAFDCTRDPLPPDAKESILRTGIVLKTKLLPPKAAPGTTPANANVEFRRRLGLFVSVRPV